MSACVTTRSDAASTYRRDISMQWWTSQAQAYDLCVSAEVIAELSHPAFPHGRDALDLINMIPLVAITDEVIGLAELLIRERAMPGPVGGDAIHVAAASVHAVHYMLSWNVRHLANPSKVVHLRTVCLRAGLVPPTIVTPDFLWKEEDDDGN